MNVERKDLATLTRLLGRVLLPAVPHWQAAVGIA